MSSEQSAQDAAPAPPGPVRDEATVRARRIKLYEEDIFGGDTDVPEVHWSVPWADLMMTMFVLFTVLFVYASAKMDYLQAFRGHVEFENVDRVSEVGARRGEVPVYDRHVPGLLPETGPQKLFESVSAAVTESALTDVHVEWEGDTVRISMHGPMLFDRFDARVRPEGLRFLSTVSAIAAKARYDVHVHGHTDNTPVHTPEYPTNWELSTARAQSVARVLMDTGRVDPARITVSGHAMYKPRTPNLTPESRLRNRRVEIELKRPEAPATIDYKGEGQ
ncbi:OmpA family protein [Desulfocurvus sp.]|jgi:chemotaxis protein MotB|uniref:OmpA/MotB family protein n=1 Tax=Desulfocurvus sp. TaxID=2871698 RepID=UPI0025BC2FC9|nr:OmpA family protein [Desulfocurvus sp.]MCK9240848.1 OmpA family protein [Desulfocurvus sp.]